MNEIEKNDIKDADRALDYLIPSTTPYPIIPMIKQQILSMISEENVIQTANFVYYRDNLEQYIDFYLKYLALGGEYARIVQIDQSKIVIAELLHRAESNQIPLQQMPDTSIESWLYIHDIQNPKLEYFLVKCWRMTEKYVGNTANGGHSVFIKLGPALTCKHLDELYRAICSYI